MNKYPLKHRNVVQQTPDLGVIPMHHHHRDGSVRPGAGRMVANESIAARGASAVRAWTTRRTNVHDFSRLHAEGHASSQRCVWKERP